MKKVGSPISSSSYYLHEASLSLKGGSNHVIASYYSWCIAMWKHSYKHRNLQGIVSPHKSTGLIWCTYLLQRSPGSPKNSVSRVMIIGSRQRRCKVPCIAHMGHQITFAESFFSRIKEPRQQMLLLIIMMYTTHHKEQHTLWRDTLWQRQCTHHKESIGPACG